MNPACTPPRRAHSTRSLNASSLLPRVGTTHAAPEHAHTFFIERPGDAIPPRNASHAYACHPRAGICSFSAIEESGSATRMIGVITARVTPQAEAEEPVRATFAALALRHLI